MKEVVIYTLYGLIPVPGLLWLGWATVLRERRFRNRPEGNVFATVNAMITFIALGGLLGALPGLLYAVQFLSFTPRNGPEPNHVLTWTLLIVGVGALCSLGGLWSFRHRLFFQKRRIPYYLTAGAVCVPLVSLAYLFADYVEFTLRHWQ